MAYQPKFAKDSRRKPPVQPAPGVQKRKVNLFFILLGIVLVPACVYATWLLLTGMIDTIGKPGAAAQEKTPSMAIMDRFDTYMTNQVSDALEGILSVKKRYWLEEDLEVTPEPNYEGYGESSDAASLGWLLEDAAELLEGQETYFSLDKTLFEGSKVNYYLDESIFVLTWKEVHNDSVYTFSEVKISHPSQLRRHLAGGEYGSDMQFYTTEMAESVNAVVASSGDFYRFREWGTSVYEGEVRRVHGTYAHTCYIDGNGDLLFTYGGEMTSMEQAKQFVAEHDIKFSLAFGPAIVDNYVVSVPNWYGLGEITEEYARAALCQMDSLHYLLVTANTEGIHGGIPTVASFAQVIGATGCKMAYCLDGGQTAAIVMNDQLINRPVYGTQRKISDIIYFATAVPEGE